MSEKISIKAQDNYVDQRTELLKFYRKERGETKTKDGYLIPLTTYDDIEQMVKWWERGYHRAVVRSPWEKDRAAGMWRDAKKKIANDSEGAKSDALYPDNEWFWNKVILQLAIYLQGAKTKPTSTDLLIESFKETIGERVEEAGDLFDDVTGTIEDAVDAVSNVGESAWSGLKIAAIVGVSAVGAAIVLPPVIRSFRD